MQYAQITLNDWMEMKNKLRQELIGIKHSFVRIGYTLRKIEEQRLYEQDGYASVAEFAKAEYGLEATTVSRFMSINKEYSIDGYSERLRPEFEEFGRSQLEEMLKLPDSDREMIEPSASRQSIRDLKAFNRQEPQQGAADNLFALVESFFKDNKEILNELYTSEAMQTGDSEAMIEIVNPGGNKTYRKGMYIMMMYEDKIKLKQFGQNPQEIQWAEFFRMTEEIFREDAGPKTWEKYFGQEETADEEDEPESSGGAVQDENTNGAAEDDGTGKNTSQTGPGDGSDIIQDIQEDDETEDGGELNDGGSDQSSGRQEENDGAGEESSQSPGESITTGTSAESAGEESQTEEIAPAQKPAEILEREQEDEAMNAPDIIDKPFGTRKDYMDTLTAYGMAVYMAEEYERHTLKVSSLAYPSELEKWLLQEVDENGRTMEEV